MKPDRKKPSVARLVERFQLRQRVACQLVGRGRTGYRYKAKPKHDRAPRERLKALAAQHTRYGYLLLHGLLKVEDLVFNKKHTYRLYTEEGLQERSKRRRRYSAAFADGLCLRPAEQWPPLPRIERC